jgi:hypothetical protein
MFNGKKIASLETRLSQLETLATELKSAHEQIHLQQSIIERQQTTIDTLIASQLDYTKLSNTIVENLDYEPLTEAVQEFLSDYDFDYDEIASNLEDAVSERVANDVDWRDVVETYASDIVGDDYSKLVQIITDQLDLNELVTSEVSEYLSKGDIPYGDIVGDWLEDNGEDLIANNLDTRAVFDALVNDLDTDSASSRDLVESLMSSFNSYNEWRVDNGYDAISIGGGSNLNLESLGSQIKAFIENETVTTEADAIGDYTPLEWSVLMVVRKAVLEIIS